MALDSTTVTVVALGVAAFALVTVVILASRLGRLERACDALLGPGRRGSFVRAVRGSRASEEALQADVDALRAEVAQARADVASALRHVAVVRYDAFADVGGRLSFSAALLDDAGDGLVLTSISGRSETRTYAKGVTAGGSEHPLSPEELDALARARTAHPDDQATRPDDRTPGGRAQARRPAGTRG